MQGRRLTALISTLLLTFFFASFLPSQASSLTSQENALSEPAPEHLSALWVLNHGGITRLDSDTGDVVLTLPNTRQAHAFAVDESSAQVWVLLPSNLQAWSFGGELAHDIVLPHVAQDSAALSVDEQRGLIWLGRHTSVHQYDHQGVHQHTVNLDEAIIALDVEPDTGTLWALTRHNLHRLDTDANALPAHAGQTLEPDDQGRTLAWDPALESVWVASEQALARYDRLGDRTFLQARQGSRHLAPDGQGLLWYSDGITLQRLDARGQAQLSLDATSATGSAQITALATVWANDLHATDVWVAGQSSISQIDIGGTVLRRFDMRRIRGFGPILAIAHYADIIPPEIRIDSPVEDSYFNNPLPLLGLSYSDSGIGINPNSLRLVLNQGELAVDCEHDANGANCYPQAPLRDRQHRLDAEIQDHAGNAAEAEPVFFTIDTVPPEMPNMGLIQIEYDDEEGMVSIHGDAGAVEPHTTLRITNLRTGETITVTVNADGSFSATLAAQPEDRLEIVVIDLAGNESEVMSVTVPANSETIPPDPSTVAPPLDPTGHTSLAAATEFLYTGSNPIQRGVEPGTIQEHRTAVIRGQVQTRDGQSLPGVTITLQGHPEFGHTLSRDDGLFDLVVNGGGIFTLNYEKEGYLPAQRKINTPWKDYVWAEDVALIQLDPNATGITLGAETLQVAQGSIEQDEDGQRQATILFPAGTQAELIMPDGSRQALSSATVRATEYTVGPNGPKAMPGELPATSAYTYAVELSLDEAIAVGAKEVRFNQPVHVYVDNFLDFPVGGIVPAGWYDREKAAWIPSDNGRVVKILAIEQNLAILDIDGSGNPAGTEALAELHITTEERTQLAELYAEGKSLWRTPIQHFTPWDCNWPYGPPEDAVPPPAEPPIPEDKDKPDDPTECTGCIIEAENQVLGESIPIVGTPYSLNYRSDRVPGNATGRTVEIPVSGSTVPATLERVVLTIQVAGQLHRQTFAPAPNQRTTFQWDGKDGLGRPVNGVAKLSYRLDYIYKAVYYEPTKFASAFSQAGTGVAIGGSRAASEVGFAREHTVSVVADAVGDSGIGRWTLDPHHTHDGADTLYRGDGTRHRATGLVSIITVAGTGVYGHSGDGGPATEGLLSLPQGVAVGPDGSLYIADTSNHRIRRVGADGVITTVAGTGALGYGGDGGPATQAQLSYPLSVALSPDGSLYIADTYNSCIRRVDADGIITKVAGTGVSGYGGDGGPATQAELNYPNDIAFGPDGSLYIADTNNLRIRRVGADGVITTVAGGAYGYDGGPANQARLNYPTGVTVAPDGNLYIADTKNHRIRRVGADGIITKVAGTGARGYSGDGGPATQAQLNWPSGITLAPDGSLYIADRYNDRIRRIGTDGVISTVAGTGVSGYGGDSGPATQAQLYNPYGITFGPDGSLYIADKRNHRIRRVAPTFTGLTDGESMVPSSDNSEYFVFDPSGRHLRTLDAVTGTQHHTFAYEATGLLQQLEDTDGNTTLIERDHNGKPIALIAPDGQRTEFTLDANGYLASVTNPAGESYRMSYTPDGLLTLVEKPSGAQFTYQYDALGRLTRDQQPDGGGWLLGRSKTATGFEGLMTSGEGRISRFGVERLSATELLRTSTAPDGTASTRRITTTEIGITETAIAADGTQRTRHKLPDPRTKMQAPYLADATVTTPGGITQSFSVDRSVTLADQDDLLSLTALSETSTVNGRTTTTAYSADNRTWSSTSANGRNNVIEVDTKGKPTTSQYADLNALHLGYDPRGRLTTLTQGEGLQARTTSLTYDTLGNLSVLEDALTRQTRFDYDLAGRVTKQRFPDGREIQYAYDANGNLTSLTPPGRNAHVFEYDAVDQETDYHPPELSGQPTPTRYRYNLDKDLTEVIRPDGQTVSLGYTPGGELDNLNLARGQYRYSYHPTTGQLTGITAPDGGTLGFTWDGFLPLSTTWNGEINGTVSQSYDKNFWVTGRSVNGDAISFGYDNDGLLTSAGSMSLTRNAANGLLTDTTLGSVTTGHQYNGFGEPVKTTASIGTETAVEMSYSRDALGRITQKTEVIEGETLIDSYQYDLAGRLTGATRNGITTTWSYDENGNRTHINGQPVAGYDEQDRLVSYQGASYEYTENGELTSKIENGATTAYDYDELGNLLQVALPGDVVVDYVIDGSNRRIGKKVNGTLTQGFLYQDQLNPVAELDGNNQVISRFIYADKINVPAYMVKGGKTYRIISDHLGSPRLIVEISSGDVAQRISYDVWGNITEDTNPGFHPFGFAGGIYDQQTKLTRFGARDYDAGTARWTSKDPIRFTGGDTNLYGYVLNDSINLVDPDGRIGIGGVATIVAVGYAIYKGYQFFSEAGAAMDRQAERNQKLVDMINGDNDINPDALQSDRMKDAVDTFENATELEGAIDKIGKIGDLRDAAKAIKQCK